MQDNKKSTTSSEYADYLEKTIWWKKLLDVQRPYKWNLKRLKPGFVLDIGCGIGRNLLHLNGCGVGVDHNHKSIEIARTHNLQAFTIEDFLISKFNKPESFDSLLFSHITEHLTKEENISIFKMYLPLLKKNGKIIIITPQELGYKSDMSHVTFMDFESVKILTAKVGLSVEKQYSFPFPRFVGNFFKYNEFVSILKK